MRRAMKIHIVARNVVLTATLAGSLVVINTHLDASREDVWRRQEIRTIMALADTAMRVFGGPVLVGGDFNSTPDSEVQRILRSSGLLLLMIPSTSNRSPWWNSHARRIVGCGVNY